MFQEKRFVMYDLFFFLSDDHEDAETDTSLQGDTVLEEEEEGEEPVDLVTF